MWVTFQIFGQIAHLIAQLALPEAGKMAARGHLACLRRESLHDSFLHAMFWSTPDRSPADALIEVDWRLGRDWRIPLSLSHTTKHFRHLLRSACRFPQRRPTRLRDFGWLG